MRDLQKERELLEKAELDDVMVFSAAEMEAVGLAEPRAGGHDEALAATVGGQAGAAESISRPRALEFQAKKGHRKPAKARSEARRAETALEALMRLGAEAAATAERLERRVDPVAGKPDEPWRKNKLQLARNAAAEMVERLLAFLDHVAGDPDVEDDDPGGGDPCDTIGNGTEGCDLEIHGEGDLASTECIDQRHIAQGDWKDRDGEMGLASTNAIDQRWSHAGSRTDREVDAFPYDAPKPGVEAGVSAWEAMQRSQQETREELRKRGLGEAAGPSNVVLVRFGRR